MAIKIIGYILKRVRFILRHEQPKAALLLLCEGSLFLSHLDQTWNRTN